MGEHGGSRPGAGRKKGSQSQKTRARIALVERLGASGLSPLDVILAAMEEAVSRGDLPAAAAFAKDAAPYMHPRLQAVIHAQKPSGKSDLEQLLDELDGRSRGLPVYNDLSDEWENGSSERLDN